MTSNASDLSGRPLMVSVVNIAGDPSVQGITPAKGLDGPSAGLCSLSRVQTVGPTQGLHRLVQGTTDPGV